MYHPQGLLGGLGAWELGGLGAYERSLPEGLAGAFTHTVLVGFSGVLLPGVVLPRLPRERMSGTPPASDRTSHGDPAESSLGSGPVSPLPCYDQTRGKLPFSQVSWRDGVPRAAGQVDSSPALPEGQGSPPAVSAKPPPANNGQQSLTCRGQWPSATDMQGRSFWLPRPLLPL